MRSKLKPTCALNDNLFNIEAKFVNLIAKSFVFKKFFNELKSIITKNELKWDNIEILLEYHRIAPIAYHVFKENGFLELIPPEFKRKIEKKHSESVIRSQIYLEEFLEIQSLCADKGIKIAPLKGIYFILDIYYPLLCREMKDIDVIVGKHDLEKAESILLDLGYEHEFRSTDQAYWRNRHFHIVFQKKGRTDNKSAAVELHFALTYKKDGLDNIPDLMKRYQNFKKNNRCIDLLSPEDNFLVFCFQERHIGRRLCMKTIIDVALLMKKHVNSFDFDYLLRQAKHLKLRAPLYFILKQVYFVFQLSFLEDVIKNIDINVFRKRKLDALIRENIFIIPCSQETMTGFAKKRMMKISFFLYDSFLQAAKALFDMRIEEFLFFFELDPKRLSTRFFYVLRPFYFLLKSAGFKK